MIDIIPTLQDNYTYAVRSGSDVILVDCGEAAPVIEYLVKHDLNATHLLCTHHHWDHIDGIPDLKKKYPRMKVYAPEKDRHRILSMDIGVSDGEKLDIAGMIFDCIETPGHTLNHICFYSGQLKALFSGDTLFSLGCGRLFEGTPEMMFASLQKLKSLPDDTNIYCGHEYTETNARFSLGIEPDNADIKSRMHEIQVLRAVGKPTLPVTLRTEKKTNLFLKADSAKNFALLREKRDHF